MYGIVGFTTVVYGSMFGIVGFTTDVDGSMLGIVVLRLSWMVLCLVLLVYDSRGWFYVWHGCFYDSCGWFYVWYSCFTTVVDGSMLGVFVLRQSWLVLCMV